MHRSFDIANSILGTIHTRSTMPYALDDSGYIDAL